MSFVYACAVIILGTRCGEGKGMLAALYPTRQRFLYAGHRAGRVNAHDVLRNTFANFVCLVRGAGLGVSVAPYPWQRRSLYACQRIGKRARGIFVFCVSAVQIFWTGRVSEMWS